VVGYPADTFCLIIKQHFSNARVTTFSFDYPVYYNLHDKCRETGYPEEDLIFGPYYTPLNGLHDLAIVFLPKSRALVELTLTMISSALNREGQLLLVGENKAGIRAYRETIENIIGPIISSTAGRHCVLYNARVSHPETIIGQITNESCTTPSADYSSPVEGERQHFSRAPTALDKWLITYPLSVRGVTLRIASLPGVFSHGHIDVGTRFLIESLDLSSASRLLDFGCGAGVIGAFVNIFKSDCLVEMVDSNALALEAARRTMKINNLPDHYIYPSDIFSGVHGKYTQIVSNPPFHRGVETDYHVVEAFIRGAADHLDRGGSLWIVANRFLKYPALIAKHFGQCRLVAENRQFRVYAATNN